MPVDPDRAVAEAALVTAGPWPDDDGERLAGVGATPFAP